MNPTLRKNIPFMALLLMTTSIASAQGVWTVDDCMRFAVDNSHTVRQSQFAADSYRASRTAAIGAFLPTVSASTNAQFNSGKTIDNATNTYGDYSQFYNGYNLWASMQLFDGLAMVNRLRQANSELRMGQTAVTRAQDEVAIDVLQAYADAVYYAGLVRVSREKLDASDSTHLQTLRHVQLGLKSEADAAQTAQQVAADRYDLVNYQGLAEKALLSLRMVMNLPDTVALALAEPAGQTAVQIPDAAEVYEAARTFNPSVVESRHAHDAARYARKAAVGDMMPSISLQAGIGSYYNKYLDTDAADAISFSQQLKGNRSQYVQAQLTIPIFDGLNKSSAFKRAKNDERTARDKYLQTVDKIREEALLATTDCRLAQANEGQAAAKVEADSIAFSVSRRQYEEGLADPIEMKTAANSLALSRQQLLQCRMTLFLKMRYLAYLMGDPIIKD